jgi:hypothetical protein
MSNAESFKARLAAGPLHLAIIVGLDVLCMALLVWLSA